MSKVSKVLVSKRALVQRINRKLAADDECLKKTRGGRMQQEFGDFYLLDTRINGVIGKDVDPEELGRKLGVLHPGEGVEE